MGWTYSSHVSIEAKLSTQLDNLLYLREISCEDINWTDIS